ncbi:MAG: sodium:proton exchanger [Candidatus Auribacter fodinae]|uniref:Sodium:proton exchanger n=1 Tax=Candidatus Auribacter fodinae TaxID=2093366 RepID=A0A3A4QUR1_9BACT|nr:MAG: sodium:proton exchanger [Candidatus Auribacter fodinae]
MNTFLYLSLIFVVSYVMRYLILKLKLPAVTGYVLGGVILGGSLFSFSSTVQNTLSSFLLTPPVLNKLSILADVALGIISFSIGAELLWESIRKLGKSIMAIVISEAIGSFILVFVLFAIFFPSNMLLGLLLGAIASATAPAATVSVISEYRASGPLTTTILAVVGIDDAISLIIFVFAATVLRGSLAHESLHFLPMIGKVGMEISLALLIGAVVGFALIRPLKKADYMEELLFLLAIGLFVCIGLAELLHTSPIMANMCFGAVAVNMYPSIKKRLHQTISGIAPLFFAIFFVLGGANLDITLLPSIGLMGLLYFVARTVGKIFCAMGGAYISKAPPLITRYIGLSLIPQVGVGVALALTIQQEFGTGAFGEQGIYIATTTMNILLFTTILTEVIGPLLTKMSLIKAGETRKPQVHQ